MISFAAVINNLNLVYQVQGACIRSPSSSSLWNVKGGIVSQSFEGKSLVMFSLLLSLLLSGCLNRKNKASIPDPRPFTSTFLEDPCQSRIRLTRGSNHWDFSRLRDAVHAAKKGDLIEVGRHSENSILEIEDKEQLVIQSSCRAKIRGLEIFGTKGLRFEGFEIDATGTRTEAVFIGKRDPKTKKPSKKNASVQELFVLAQLGGDNFGGGPNEANAASGGIYLGQNRIHSTSPGEHGIYSTDGTTQLVIEGNQIYDNGGNGILIQGQPNGSVTLIAENLILDNELNGIYLQGQGRYEVNGNLVAQNGTGSPSGRDGYGLKVSNNLTQDPDQIILLGNTFFENEGLSQPGVSSPDIQNYQSVLSEEDVGNKTTSGDEGGALLFSDTTAPIVQMISASGFSTRNPNYRLLAEVDDTSPVIVEIRHNGQLLLTQNLHQIELSLSLSLGVNLIQIRVEDAQGLVTVFEVPPIQYDLTPPGVLSLLPPNGSIVRSADFLVQASFDEPLQRLTVNGQSVPLSPWGTSLSQILEAESPGPWSAEVVLTDLAGNTSTFTLNYEIILDDVPPHLNVTFPSLSHTNQTQFPISVRVEDESPTWTRVYVDDELLFETRAIDFEFPVTLATDGEHQVRVESIDDSQNQALSQSWSVNRDTVPPLLSHFKPSGLVPILERGFIASAQANEILKSAKINGESATLDEEMKTLFRGLGFLADGPQTLIYSAMDRAGNESTTSIHIQIQAGTLDSWTYSECSWDVQ